MTLAGDEAGNLRTAIGETLSVVVGTRQHGEQYKAFAVEVVVFQNLLGSKDSDFVGVPFASNSVRPDQACGTEHERVAVVRPNGVNNAESLQSCTLGFCFCGRTVMWHLKVIE